jgi:N-acetylglutamate synthase
MDLAALQSAADANFLASFRKLVEHSPAGELRETGGVFRFTSGLPIGLFNGCVVVDRIDPSDLEAAIRWLRLTDLPFRVWIREALAPALADVPRGLGLAEEAGRYPGMALAPIPDPPDPPPGIVVRQVTDEGGLDEHRGILRADGSDESIICRLLPASLLSDPEVSLATVLLDGQPVGHSLAIRSGDVSGVYNVGTLPSARRRGVGTAATWAALAAGRRWGCRAAALQASDMGQPIYEAMGFRTVVRYVEFRSVR